jgi:Acetyltransferase (GNAT) family
MNGTLARPRAGGRGAPAAGATRDSGTTPAGRYRVRTAGPADAGLIRDFVCGLSVRTQYFRFFTAVSPPSSGLLRVLSGGGPADVLVISDGTGAVVGHGMAVDDGRCGLLSANVGLVIADDWQGQGLGTTLLRMLTDRAARRGVAALVFDVLPTNVRMLGIIDRHWPDAARQRTADAIIIRAEIAGPASARDTDQGAGHESGRPAA